MEYTSGRYNGDWQKSLSTILQRTEDNLTFAPSPNQPGQQTGAAPIRTGEHIRATTKLDDAEAMVRASDADTKMHLKGASDIITEKKEAMRSDAWIYGYSAKLDSNGNSRATSPVPEKDPLEELAESAADLGGLGYIYRPGITAPGVFDQPSTEKFLQDSVSRSINDINRRVANLMKETKSRCDNVLKDLRSDIMAETNAIKARSTLDRDEIMATLSDRLKRQKEEWEGISEKVSNVERQARQHERDREEIRDRLHEKMSHITDYVEESLKGAVQKLSGQVDDVGRNAERREASRRAAIDELGAQMKKTVDQLNKRVDEVLTEERMEYLSSSSIMLRSLRERVDALEQGGRTAAEAKLESHRDILGSLEKSRNHHDAAISNLEVKLENERRERARLQNDFNRLVQHVTEIQSQPRSFIEMQAPPSSSSLTHLPPRYSDLTVAVSHEQQPSPVPAVQAAQGEAASPGLSQVLQSFRSREALYRNMSPSPTKSPARQIVGSHSHALTSIDIPHVFLTPHGIDKLIRLQAVVRGFLARKSVLAAIVDSVKAHENAVQGVAATLIQRAYRNSPISKKSKAAFSRGQRPSMDTSVTSDDVLMASIDVDGGRTPEQQKIVTYQARLQQERMMRLSQESAFEERLSKVLEEERTARKRLEEQHARELERVIGAVASARAPTLDPQDSNNSNMLQELWMKMAVLERDNADLRVKAEAGRVEMESIAVAAVESKMARTEVSSPASSQATASPVKGEALKPVPIESPSASSTPAVNQMVEEQRKLLELQAAQLKEQMEMQSRLQREHQDNLDRMAREAEDRMRRAEEEREQRWRLEDAKRAEDAERAIIAQGQNVTAHVEPLAHSGGKGIVEKIEAVTVVSPVGMGSEGDKVEPLSKGNAVQGNDEQAGANDDQTGAQKLSPKLSLMERRRLKNMAKEKAEPVLSDGASSTNSGPVRGSSAKPSKEKELKKEDSCEVAGAESTGKEMNEDSVVVLSGAQALPSILKRSNSAKTLSSEGSLPSLGSASPLKQVSNKMAMFDKLAQENEDAKAKNSQGASSQQVPLSAVEGGEGGPSSLLERRRLKKLGSAPSSLGDPVFAAKSAPLPDIDTSKSPPKQVQFDVPSSARSVLSISVPSNESDVASSEGSNAITPLGSAIDANYHENTFPSPPSSASAMSGNSETDIRKSKSPIKRVQEKQKSESPIRSKAASPGPGRLSKPRSASKDDSFARDEKRTLEMSPLPNQMSVPMTARALTTKGSPFTFWKEEEEEEKEKKEKKAEALRREFLASAAASIVQDTAPRKANPFFGDGYDPEIIKKREEEKERERREKEEREIKEALEKEKERLRKEQEELQRQKTVNDDLADVFGDEFKDIDLRTEEEITEQKKKEALLMEQASKVLEEAQALAQKQRSEQEARKSPPGGIKKQIGKLLHGPERTSPSRGLTGDREKDKALLLSQMNQIHAALTQKNISKYGDKPTSSAALSPETESRSGHKEKSSTWKMIKNAAARAVPRTPSSKRSGAFFDDDATSVASSHMARRRTVPGPSNVDLNDAPKAKKKSSFLKLPFPMTPRSRKKEIPPWDAASSIQSRSGIATPMSVDDTGSPGMGSPLQSQLQKSLLAKANMGSKGADQTLSPANTTTEIIEEIVEDEVENEEGEEDREDTSQLIVAIDPITEEPLPSYSATSPAPQSAAPPKQASLPSHSVASSENQASVQQTDLPARPLSRTPSERELIEGVSAKLAPRPASPVSKIPIVSALLGKSKKRSASHSPVRKGAVLTPVKARSSSTERTSPGGRFETLGAAESGTPTKNKAKKFMKMLGGVIRKPSRDRLNSAGDATHDETTEAADIDAAPEPQSSGVDAPIIAKKEPSPPSTASSLQQPHDMTRDSSGGLGSSGPNSAARIDELPAPKKPDSLSDLSISVGDPQTPTSPNTGMTLLDRRRMKGLAASPVAKLQSAEVTGENESNAASPGDKAQHVTPLQVVRDHFGESVRLSAPNISIDSRTELSPIKSQASLLERRNQSGGKTSALSLSPVQQTGPVETPGSEPTAEKGSSPGVVLVPSASPAAKKALSLSPISTGPDSGVPSPGGLTLLERRKLAKLNADASRNSSNAESSPLEKDGSNVESKNPPESTISPVVGGGVSPLPSPEAGLTLMERRKLKLQEKMKGQASTSGVVPADKPGLSTISSTVDTKEASPTGLSLMERRMARNQDGLSNASPKSEGPASTGGGLSLMERRRMKKQIETPQASPERVTAAEEDCSLGAGESGLSIVAPALSQLEKRAQRQKKDASIIPLQAGDVDEEEEEEDGEVIEETAIAPFITPRVRTPKLRASWDDGPNDPKENAPSPSRALGSHTSPKSTLSREGSDDSIDATSVAEPVLGKMGHMRRRSRDMGRLASEESLSSHGDAGLAHEHFSTPPGVGGKSPRHEEDTMVMDLDFSDSEKESEDEKPSTVGSRMKVSALTPMNHSPNKAPTGPVGGVHPSGESFDPPGDSDKSQQGLVAMSSDVDEEEEEDGSTFTLTHGDRSFMAKGPDASRGGGASDDDTPAWDALEDS